MVNQQRHPAQDLRIGGRLIRIVSRNNQQYLILKQFLRRIVRTIQRNIPNSQIQFPFLQPADKTVIGQFLQIQAYIRMLRYKFPGCSRYQRVTARMGDAYAKDSAFVSGQQLKFLLHGFIGSGNGFNILIKFLPFIGQLKMWTPCKKDTSQFFFH